MTETLAPRPAPAPPLSSRVLVPVPRAGEGWKTSSYCSDCHRNHPGPCGCWCHRPADDRIESLSRALAAAGFGASLALAQPRDRETWKRVAALLSDWGMP